MCRDTIIGVKKKTILCGWHRPHEPTAPRCGLETRSLRVKGGLIQAERDGEFYLFS